MATWNSDNIIITKKGEEVLSKVLAGIGKLTISRVVTGASYVSPSKLYSQTQVSDIRQELDITSYSTTNEGTSLALRVSNKELESSYPLYQIGIYVTHPDFSEEILYVIAQCDTDNPDIIPLPSETPVSLNYNFYLAHSGTSDVKITISDAGLVSVGEFESYKQEVTTELGKKATKEQGEKADTAVQSIEIGGVNQSKTVDGKVNLPAYPTKLPADGGNADTLGKLPVNAFIRHLGMVDDVDFLNDIQDYSYEAWISATTSESLGLPSKVHIFRSFKVKPKDTTSDGTSVVGGNTHNFQLAISEYGTTMSRISISGTMTGWGNWGNIADGCNAGLFDGNSVDKFLKYNGIATDCNKCTTRGVYQTNSSTLNVPNSAIISSLYTPILFVIDETCQLFFTGTEIYKRSGISLNGGSYPDWKSWTNVADGGNASTVGGKSLSDLMVWGMSYDERTKITSGNLDDYTKVGSYVVTSADTAAAIENSPWTKTGYFLDVYYRTTGYCVQVAMTWDGYIKIRALNANTWYQWRDIVHSNYAASSTTSGIVTTSMQHFKGYKFFDDNVYIPNPKVVMGNGAPSADTSRAFVITSSDNLTANCLANFANVARANGNNELYLQLRSFTSKTLLNCLISKINANGTNSYTMVTNPIEPARSALRNLSSGSATPQTKDSSAAGYVPSGSWYGKHD